MFRLPKGRFIVGYALGDDGMLFRGELIDGCSEDQARQHCRWLPTIGWNWTKMEEEAELVEV